MQNKFSLIGKNALVYSPQFVYGEEIAAGLIEAGANVWICGEDIAALRALYDKLDSAGLMVQGIIEYHQGKEADAVLLAQKVREEIGVLDIFIDNGSNCLMKGWIHTFEEIYENFKRTQLGLMLTVKHIGMIMTDQGFGSVIFISDYAALVGYDVQNYENDPDKFDEDFSLIYGFVKGSYVNYTRQAAGFLGENNVRCNCIAFAPMENMISKGFTEAFIKHSHLKRLANKEDVKAPVIFLASDASAYITGITLPVDGGYTAK